MYGLIQGENVLSSLFMVQFVYAKFFYVRIVSRPMPITSFLPISFNGFPRIFHLNTELSNTTHRNEKLLHSTPADLKSGSGSGKAELHGTPLAAIGRFHSHVSVGK